jgi:hypothetical protein
VTSEPLDNKESEMLKQAFRAIFSFSLLAVAGTAHASVIDLQASGVTGTGSLFASAGNAEQVSITTGGYTVVLSGGTPLGPNISNLPATDSIAYGTSNTYTVGESGYTNPITINFYAAGTNTPQNVTNFFLNLYNGNTVPVNYTLANSLGNALMYNIGNNFSGGQKTFGLPSAGSSVFTITAGPATGGCCGWDYFVGDIGFNQALPTGSTNGGTPVATPIPSSLVLFGSSLAGLGLIRRRITRSVRAA